MGIILHTDYSSMLSILGDVYSYSDPVTLTISLGSFLLTAYLMRGFYDNPGLFNVLFYWYGERGFNLVIFGDAIVLF